MKNSLDEISLRIGRLADTLASEIDELSDEELVREAREDYGSLDTAALETKNVIQAAIREQGKRRLAIARSEYQAYQERSGSRVHEWSSEKKRALVDQIWMDPDLLPGELTLAARNEEDLKSDVDSILEDLIDLDVIDDEGNIL